MQIPVQRPATLTYGNMYLHLFWFSVHFFKVHFPYFVALAFVDLKEKTDLSIAIALK